MFAFKPTHLHTREFNKTFAPAEERFWKQFETVHSETISNTCRDLVYNERKGFLAYATTKEVRLFDLKSRSVKTRVKKEDNRISSLAVRDDGELLCWGNDKGILKILACKQRVVLKTIGISKNRPVGSVAWSQNSKSWILTGDDSFQVSVLDFVNKKVIFQNADYHSDFVRSAKFLNDTDDVIVSGGLDQKIAMFDIRDGARPITEIPFGYEVEKISIFHPGSAIFSDKPSAWSSSDSYSESNRDWICAAGGRKVACYDPRMTNQPIYEFTNNIKTVSALALSSRRLLSGAQDGIIKVYSPDNNSNLGSKIGLVYQTRVEEGVMSIAVDSACLNYAVLTMEGRLTCYQKKFYGSAVSGSKSKINGMGQAGGEHENGVSVTSNGIRYSQKTLIERLGRGFRISDRGSYKYYQRGRFQKFQTESESTRITQKRSGRIPKYDMYLQRFDFKKALLSALETNNTQIIMSVVEQLMLQDALHTGLALFQDDDVAMIKLLSFLMKKVNSDNTASLLDYLLEQVLELDLGLGNPEVLALVEGIEAEIGTELETQCLQDELTLMVGDLGNGQES